MLGSKDRVIQACKLDQAKDGRRKLYIIDGDLELLTGRGKPGLLHLYRLRGYCIENYLLDEDAIVSAVTTLNTRKEESVARAEIDVSDWMRRNQDCLRKLFICYAVSYEMNREAETVGYSVYRLLAPGVEYDFCERKVSSRVMSLYRGILRGCSKRDARRVYNRVRRNADLLGAERFASGKDHIYVPIYQRMKSRNAGNIRKDVFKVLVAQCLEKAEDPYLLRRIRRLCA